MAEKQSEAGRIYQNLLRWSLKHKPEEKKDIGSLDQNLLRWSLKQIGIANILDTPQLEFTPLEFET